MVYVRLNERESNPNPAVNFISVLDPEDEDARQLLRALAAQLKPVMKAHGFNVNSFEEVSRKAISLYRDGLSLVIQCRVNTVVV
jgi:DNA-dependent metalloprotease WSS1